MPKKWPGKMYIDGRFVHQWLPVKIKAMQS